MTAHSTKITQVIPNVSQTLAPIMTPLALAFHAGQQARHLGRLADNPHADKLAPNHGQLATEWDRGYNS
jgi:hypothetical protein